MNVHKDTQETIDAFLDEIAKRGMTIFSIVCDESNNSPKDVAQGHLNLDIVFKAVPSVDFIELPLTNK